MEVRDDRAWAAQVVELGRDEPGEMFLDFLLGWVDYAESVMGGGRFGPRAALLEALERVEQARGFVSVEWLSQMLLVLTGNWRWGDDLWSEMSGWERRMVEQAAVLKIADLQRSARSADDDGTVLAGAGRGAELDADGVAVGVGVDDRLDGHPVGDPVDGGEDVGGAESVGDGAEVAGGGGDVP